MQGAVTAVYRSHDAADLVRDELERAGIGRHQITVVPETERGSDPGTTRDIDDALDRLHDLHLPDDDTRTYQQAVRNGDYVVSVNLDGDDSVSQVQDLMRRPEHSYDLDELDNRYSGRDYAARRQPLGEGYDERQIGRRNADQASPYTRSYTRGLPVPPIALM